MELLPNDLDAIHSTPSPLPGGALPIRNSGDGFRWQGTVAAPGRYQVWVTYYCEDRNASARLDLNGVTRTKPIMYMGADEMRKFYGKNGEPLGRKDARPRYYFREYWGAYDVKNKIEMTMAFANASNIDVKSVEIIIEREFRRALESLLFSAIDFYDGMRVPGKLVRCTYNIQKHKKADFSSTAVCGITLMACAMNHELGRDPNAARKALSLLGACNGKNPGVKPDRHHTGFFMHFVNARTGKGSSEYSTIDTSILVSGALVARNTFHDQRIRDEADELWNSIDWSTAVAKAHPIDPEFYLTGAQIDGKKRGTISMFNEYILLAWFCQHYENQRKGENARSIMPELDKLPRAVYKNRILLGSKHGRPQPSFLVQFPFYMSDLCNSELFFSYAAAQALADRTTCTEKYGERSAWGVGPGCTPEKGYSVDSFAGNPEDVVSPRMVAGFIPVLPRAADDLYSRWKAPGNRLNLEFGTILPRFVPHRPWKPYRLAGVDFSCLLFGLAAHHPKLGMEFFREKTRFTFNK